MSTEPTKNCTPRARILCLCLATMALGACSVLQPKATTPPSFYALEYTGPVTKASMEHSALSGNTPTLVISPVRAASGFDSQRIIYLREPHKLEYFAHNEWIDTPARMLGPLMVTTLEQTDAFKAVVMTPGSASGELRLDTEIVRLQQNFQSRPSTIQFALRVYLVEEKTRKVVSWRLFEAQVPTTSEDPRSGVVAANRAVKTVLEELSQFLLMRPK